MSVLKTVGRVVVALLVFGALHAAAANPQPEFECLGVVEYPSGTEVDGLVVGGLSGITFDEQNNVYYVISDDRAQVSPARFFRVEIDLDGAAFEAGDVRFVNAVKLRDRDGQPFASGMVDPEGITLDRDGTLLISSEGAPSLGVDAFVRRYNLNGAFVAELKLPEHFLLGPDRGVRRNLGLEALDFTPDRQALFTVGENALRQDGPQATPESGSLSRIVEFEAGSWRAVREYVYHVDPVAATPIPDDGMQGNGVTDILAIDGRSLLAIERSFSQGRGFSIRLYFVDLGRASNVIDVDALHEVDLDGIRLAEKTLVLDFADLGFSPDNLEGITFGPDLEDGRRTVIMFCDDNFNAPEQKNQIIAFAVRGLEVEPRPRTSIAEVQGPGHRSPLEHQWVDGVRGIVTAASRDRRGLQHCWLQAPVDDGDPLTSNAVLAVGRGALRCTPGDDLSVSGRVVEQAWRGELSTTRIQVFGSTVHETGAELPKPVRIGREGRKIPSEVVDDDGLAEFDPAHDAIDFYESLEGMLVEIPRPVVVGPTTQYGGLVVLADGGDGAIVRSSRGGLIAGGGDVNPERLIVDDRLVPKPPLFAVGQRLRDDVVGVVHYGYGNFQILNTGALAAARGAAAEPEVTDLVGDAESLTVSTCNVENLSLLSSDRKFNRVARSIAVHLNGPDIVVLEEIQDDSGPSDDGVVSADRTLARLVESIEKAGGPRYDWRQHDPVDGRDGGRPGANIRVVFLYNPDRVSFVDAGDCRTAGIGSDGSLQCSPGRFGEDEVAFAGRPGHDGEGSRRPLIGEFEFNGHRFVVVGVHLSSKIGDDRIFGARQPRVLKTDGLREAQARALAAWIDEFRSRRADARLVVLGDFNDDADRPAVQRVAHGALVNLVERIPLADRYTHVYEGNAHAIDHILVTEALADGAEVDIVHVSADYPARQRASDHDPVVVRLRF